MVFYITCVVYFFFPLHIYASSWPGSVQILSNLFLKAKIFFVKVFGAKSEEGKTFRL